MTGSEQPPDSPEKTPESPTTIVTTIVNPPAEIDPAELAAALARLTDAERAEILRLLRAD